MSSSKEKQELEEFEFQLRSQEEYTAAREQPQAEAAAADQQAQGTFVDPSDGTVYEWDYTKRAWFPKIDNDFIASYQASYGIATSYDDLPPEPGSSSKQQQKGQTASAAPADGEKAAADSKDENKEGASKEKKRKAQEQAWFDIDDEHNTSVYVSDMPLDTTEEEFVTLMRKCGIIMDEEDGTPKIKLYKTPTGEQKGDGLCCYLKVESVQLALQLLDQSIFNGKKITVQRAKFQQKGDYNPSLKKKKNQKKKKKFKGQEKLLDWRERKQKDDSKIGKKWEKVVIFQHLFDPKEFDDDPTVITDIRDDLRSECEKMGAVKKVMIFDRHPDGVASVAFSEFEAADQCVTKMNGRWFGGNQLEVFKWDGFTNYQVEETSRERDVRLEKWEKYISEGERKTTEEEGAMQTEPDKQTPST